MNGDMISPKCASIRIYITCFTLIIHDLWYRFKAPKTLVVTFLELNFTQRKRKQDLVYARATGAGHVSMYLKRKHLPAQ